MRSSLKRLVPSSLRPRIRRLYYAPLDLLESVRGNRLPMTPPRGISNVGGGDFHLMGQRFLKYFVEFGSMGSEDRVLDVGCGIGRMAVPLTGYLDPERGSYEGFDIVAQEVDWCRNNVTPKYPHFRFAVADIYNKEYNPSGRYSASEYRFSYEDDSFDFVFLTSVFTHLLPEDLENYVGQIARVLAPGGVCMGTLFLLNAESLAGVESGRSTIPLPHNHGFYRIKEQTVPEAAIAYEESYIRELFAQHSLNIEEPVRYGSWSGRKVFVDYQDIVVVRKASSR